MRSLVKVLVITLLVGYVGAQFLPDVIHVPKRWPPRFPRVEFVHEHPDTVPAPVATAPPDTMAPQLPPVAAAPSLDAAKAAREAKRDEARALAAMRRAKAKARAKSQALPEEDGWNATEPTAMVVPVHITTEVELSGDSERIPTPPAPEPKAGDEWPVLCGQVVDASGAAVEGADVRIESSDTSERTDHDGRFCLASPTRKVTLLVGAEGRDSVRYAVELDGRTTQVHITLR
jgi:hypothetical protein